MLKCEKNAKRWKPREITPSQLVLQSPKHIYIYIYLFNIANIRQSLIPWQGRQNRDRSSLLKGSGLANSSRNTANKVPCDTGRSCDMLAIEVKSEKLQTAWWASGANQDAQISLRPIPGIWYVAIFWSVFIRFKKYISINRININILFALFGT